MYDNPDDIKDREVRLRLTRRGLELLDEMARRHGVQRAVMARMLVTRGIKTLDERETQHRRDNGYEPLFSLPLRYRQEAPA